MFILSSISSALQFWSVNHNSTYENSESNVFKNIKFLGKISNNWVKDLLGIKLNWLLNLVENHCFQYYNRPILLH